MFECQQALNTFVAKKTPDLSTSDLALEEVPFVLAEFTSASPESLDKFLSLIHI